MTFVMYILIIVSITILIVQVKDMNKKQLVINLLKLVILIKIERKVEYIPHFNTLVDIANKKYKDANLTYYNNYGEFKLRAWCYRLGVID